MTIQKQIIRQGNIGIVQMIDGPFAKKFFVLSGHRWWLARNEAEAYRIYNEQLKKKGEK